jgi:hypothetical protein
MYQLTWAPKKTSLKNEVCKVYGRYYGCPGNKIPYNLHVQCKPAVACQYRLGKPPLDVHTAALIFINGLACSVYFQHQFTDSLI